LKTLWFTTALGITALFFSCLHKSDIPAQPEISFSQQVQPIIIGNCTESGCHDNANSGIGERLPLMTYNDISREVTPGDARGSRLYQAITSATQKMPPAGYMNESSIQAIYLWIEQGAKNN
jgi:hypothetical protein